MLARCTHCERTFVAPPFGRQTGPQSGVEVIIEDPTGRSHEETRPAPPAPNPYAAPAQAGTDDDLVPLPPDDVAPEWTVRNLYARAWLIFRRYWPALLAPALLDVGPSIILEPALERVPGGGPTAILTRAFLSFGTVVLVATMDAGWTAQWLAAARGLRPTFNQFAAGLSRALPVVAVELLVKVTADGIGTYMAIFGIHMSTWFSFFDTGVGAVVGVWETVAICAILDEGATPVQSIVRAWKLSVGCRGRMVVTGLVATALVFLGLVLWLVGVFPAATLIQGVPVVLYLRLRAAEARDDSGRSTDGVAGG
jgi:hypothetical protein